MSKIYAFMQTVAGLVAIVFLTGFFALRTIDGEKSEALKMSGYRWIVTDIFHQEAAGQNQEYVSVTLTRLDDNGRPIAEESTNNDDVMTNYTFWIGNDNPDLPKYRNLERGEWVYLEYQDDPAPDAVGLYGYLRVDTNVLES